MLNKFKKISRFAVLPVIILGIAVTLFAFKKGKQSFKMKTPVAYALNFSVQTTSTTAYENTFGTAYQNVQPITSNENKSFDIQVSQSGELDMTIRDLAPTGECVVTKLQNNTLTLYNAYGGVIEQITLDANALDLASLASLVTMGDKNAVLERVSNVENGIAEPLTEGISESPKRLRKMGAGKVLLQSDEGETKIDTQNGLVMSNKTLSNGSVVSETTYNSSRDASGAYILSSTQETSYDAVPNTNVRVVTSVSSNYTNFRLPSGN